MSDLTWQQVEPVLRAIEQWSRWIALAALTVALLITAWEASRQ